VIAIGGTSRSVVEAESDIVILCLECGGKGNVVHFLKSSIIDLDILPFKRTLQSTMDRPNGGKCVSAHRRINTPPAANRNPEESAPILDE
jgi:hypothetical protein